MGQARVSNGHSASQGAGGPDREELAAFLAQAPEGLKEWAAEQLAGLGEDGDPGDDEVPADTEDEADVEDVLAEDEEIDAPPAATGRRGRDRASSTLERRTGVSRLNLILVALLAAAVVVIVRQAGQDNASVGMVLPSGHPSISATMSASEIAALDQAEPVDPEREAELLAQAEADPEDLESRQELGVMYLRAALYQKAAIWLQQILDVDPDNLAALLAIGVVEYQSNQYEQAETHWLRASELAPQAAEPWYNLGFLYMARTPPDTERANECWEKVLQLAPDSAMATEVREHVGTMGSATATPSAG
ncbi:tetratricopeptide repeat protein [Actinomyces qiguomingii]|uniref:tetratricopeptide repeat protein n=1 Tax=Actinomyces qiguomingii TaxID=2057800 RepID=UPI000CA0036F|nr:tetratricopeptide repeat protein [Actinomyces qiguomingii]